MYKMYTHKILKKIMLYICALYICPVSASGGRIFPGGICGLVCRWTFHWLLPLVLGAWPQKTHPWVVRYITDMPWFYVHTHNSLQTGASHDPCVQLKKTFFFAGFKAETSMKSENSPWNLKIHPLLHCQNLVEDVVENFPAHPYIPLGWGCVASS